MTEAEAWKRQADSDFAAAGKVFSQEDASTYCQAIAKYQQVVEKSINYIDATLRQHGILNGRAKAEHYPERMVNRLVRIPQSGSRDISSRLNRLFSRWLPEINNLCNLAPKLPPQGEPYRRNTEYPFQLSNGNWTAPAANDAFLQRDVVRFKEVARRFRAETERIAIALQLD